MPHQGQILAPKNGRWMNKDALYLLAMPAKNLASATWGQRGDKHEWASLGGRPACCLAGGWEGRKLVFSATCCSWSSIAEMWTKKRRDGGSGCFFWDLGSFLNKCFFTYCMSWEQFLQTLTDHCYAVFRNHLFPWSGFSRVPDAAILEVELVVSLRDKKSRTVKKEMDSFPEEHLVSKETRS